MTRYANPMQALRWAYEATNIPVVTLSPVGEIRGGKGNISANDRHVQANLILSMCERVLPALHMAYIRVQFGREAGGFDLLTRHLAANFGTGLHSRRGIEQIIRAYCGEKIGLREIRKCMACGTLKAAALRNGGYDALDLIHTQAMDILEREMNVRGLLRYELEGTPTLGGQL